MSARAKNRLTVMKKLVVILAATAVLAGCAQAASVMQTPGVTLPPPTPAGMEEVPPELVRVPEEPDDECDRTASLRPFNNRADADAAVANIRGARAADRRTRHRQQPVLVPRPDHR